MTDDTSGSTEPARSAESRVAQRGWRPERPLAIRDAVSLWLDHLEIRYETVETSHRRRPPVRCGLDALDELLGGGLAPGSLTVLVADAARPATAVACTVARRSPHRVVLDAGDLYFTVADLVAGATGVPAALLRTGHLGARHWEAIEAGLRSLAERRLALGSATSAVGFDRLLDGAGPELAVVSELCRYGDLEATVAQLAASSRRRSVAVLATVTADDPAAFEPVGEALVMRSTALGSKATISNRSGASAAIAIEPTTASAT